MLLLTTERFNSSKPTSSALLSSTLAPTRRGKVTLPYRVKSSHLGIQSPTLREALATPEPEFIVTGTVESGKSHPMCHRLYQLHCLIPNLKTFICRKAKTDMRKSIIDQFENEVLPYHVDDPRSPCKAYGGHNPSAYLWQNGGVTYVFGIREATSMLGAQFDAGYVCQAEQLTLEEWEFLSHRCGRAGNWLDEHGVRQGQIWGDANPDVGNHWIPKRVDAGKLTMFTTSFQDNPLFYYDGEWTEYGRKRVAYLKTTVTGVRYRRLIEGEWCNAENLVFPEFDPQIHVLDTLPDDIANWDYYVGIDYGHSSPLVVGWLAYNRETDVFIVAKEWRYSNTLIEDHIAAIYEHSKGLNIVLRVSDHDSQMNHQLQDAGIGTENANKEPGSILRGCDFIRLRLRDRKLFFYRYALIERDPVLEDRNAPLDGIEEMQGYRHKPIEKHVGDSTKDDLPVKGDDHMIDLIRYVLDKVDSTAELNIEVDPFEIARPMAF